MIPIPPPGPGGAAFATRALLSNRCRRRQGGDGGEGAGPRRVPGSPWAPSPEGRWWGLGPPESAAEEGEAGLGGRPGHHRRRRGRAGPREGDACEPGAAALPRARRGQRGSCSAERGCHRPVRRGRRAPGAASNFPCPGNCGRPRGRLVLAGRNTWETWALRTDLTL